AADHVIVTTPQQDPFVEAQAYARVDRKGQHRIPTMTRLIACGTVDEDILRARTVDEDILRARTVDDVGNKGGRNQESANMFYFLEGNIAAGKSTFLDLFKDHQGCIVAKEPVDDWSAPLDGDGDGILQLYYRSKETHAFAFQATVMLSRVTQLLTLMRDHPGATILAERSPASGGIFVKQLRSEGVLTSVQCALHERWIQMSEALVQTAGIVYLRVSPETCMERLRRRNRNGEALIDKQLIVDLHQLHDEHITDMEARGHRVLRLDGDADPASWLLDVQAFVRSPLDSVENVTV
ncbi:Deoxynucleoside kinase, partial [Tetrabaena socialis]